MANGIFAQIAGQRSERAPVAAKAQKRAEFHFQNGSFAFCRAAFCFFLGKPAETQRRKARGPYPTPGWQPAASPEKVFSSGRKQTFRLYLGGFRNGTE